MVRMFSPLLDGQNHRKEHSRMGNKKKYAFLILVVFAVLVTSVGHTLAYLTDIDISISRFDVLISEPS